MIFIPHEFASNEEMAFSGLSPAVQMFLIKIAPLVVPFFKEALEQKCSKCGQTKPVSEFYRRLQANKPWLKKSFTSKCKECLRPGASDRMKKWIANNPARWEEVICRKHAIACLRSGDRLPKEQIPEDLIQLAATRLQIVREIKRMAKNEQR